MFSIVSYCATVCRTGAMLVQVQQQSLSSSLLQAALLHHFSWSFLALFACKGSSDRLLECLIATPTFFWSLDLLEAIQGIAFSVSVRISSYHLLNFSVFRHVFISSLDMFENCINSYHIDSEQVETCLRIIWIVTILILNKFRHI